MSAAALLAKTPHPTDAQIHEAMEGNLCPCGTYLRIREAIHRAVASATHGARPIASDAQVNAPATHASLEHISGGEE